MLIFSALISAWFVIYKFNVRNFKMKISTVEISCTKILQKPQNHLNDKKTDQFFCYRAQSYLCCLNRYQQLRSKISRSLFIIDKTSPKPTLNSAALLKARWVINYIFKFTFILLSITNVLYFQILKQCHVFLSI